jgi:hypothetical protein
VACLLKRRETGEEGGGEAGGGGPVWGGAGPRWRNRGVREHGRGEVLSGGAHLEERERRAHGSAQEKEKRAGPKGIVIFLIYSNNFQTSLNCFDQKVDLPNSKNFK